MSDPTRTVAVTPTRTVRAGPLAPNFGTPTATAAVQNADDGKYLEGRTIGEDWTILGFTAGDFDTLKGHRIRRVRGRVRCATGDPANPNAIDVRAASPGKVGYFPPALPLVYATPPGAALQTFTGAWFGYRPTATADVGGPWSVRDLETVELGLEIGGGPMATAGLIDYLELEIEAYLPAWPRPRRHFLFRRSR